MLVRLALATTLLLAGCGSTTEAAGDAGPASRVERCTERFLARIETKDDSTRRYVERTYCARFEQRGWIYDDGALSIDAHVWLAEGGSEVCARAEAGGEAATVPCEELRRNDPPEPLECAILHHVRRSEVREYVAELQRTQGVRCDDETPLDELGAG